MAKVFDLHQVAEQTVKLMCEGFCEYLPTRTRYDNSMGNDCAVCKLRAALAEEKEERKNGM